jgi:predicted PurR-regulated permease PerM
MIKKGKKIPYIELVPILLIAMLMFKMVDKPSILTNSIKYFSSIASYLIWALGIAYLLNPIMVFLEKRLKVRRIVSILIIYVFLLAVIFISVTVITPILVNNVQDLWANMPNYISSTESWITKTIESLKSQDKYNIEPFVIKYVNDILSEANKFINLPISFLLKKTVDLTSTLFKLFFGLIIAIYILNDKEKLIRNTKKLMYAFLDKSVAFNLINIGRKVNLVFSKFIFGKAIDSAIIGAICFVFMAIFKMPFTLLISLIVGVTNMIPYVGPFLGAIPAILITLFVSPIKAIWIAIFILILQQFDGWYLGPKIIGDQVGISPLLILTAIILGGGTFGIMGMFLGVPFLAVIQMFLSDHVEKKLKSRNVNLKDS